MTDDEWDALTPKQQQEQLTKMRADQRRRDASMKKVASDMAEFVCANPHAVIEMTSSTDSTPGLRKRYSLHIEVDGERYAKFMRAREKK